ncbi:type I-E CRISPR-associated protein Cas7/Cse4/CasC [Holzapfeliella sp. JNUCC 72]
MKNNKNLFIDVHALQTVPPANINRDDTGSPKTAQYGGTTRSRVSSQAWKKAMRSYFIDHMDEHELGIRTLEVVSYLAGKIQDIDDSIEKEDAMKKADEALKKIGLKTTDSKANADGKKHKLLKALFFIGDEQATNLAQAVVDGVDSKKELQAILKDNPAVDIALFGRMVADDPMLNEDASAQVGHAISTHAIQPEFDFFTATDEYTEREATGAGMLGTTEYNSSTLYRYANIAGHELTHQLGDAQKAAQAIKLFIESFVKSMPTGKINSFANQTLPQALMVTIRTDRPISLVTAFEKPVLSTDGYVEKSIEKLTNEFNQTADFVERPVKNYTVGFDLNGTQTTLSDLLDDLSAVLTEQLENA